MHHQLCWWHLQNLWAKWICSRGNHGTFTGNPKAFPIKQIGRVLWMFLSTNCGCLRRIMTCQEWLRSYAIRKMGLIQCSSHGHNQEQSDGNHKGTALLALAEPRTEVGFGITTVWMFKSARLRCGQKYDSLNSADFLQIPPSHWFTGSTSCESIHRATCSSPVRHVLQGTMWGRQIAKPASDMLGAPAVACIRLHRGIAFRLGIANPGPLSETKMAWCKHLCKH